MKNFTFTDMQEKRALDVNVLGVDREDAAERFKEHNGFDPDIHPWPDHMFELKVPKPRPPKPKPPFVAFGEAAAKSAEAANNLSKVLEEQRKQDIADKPKPKFVRKPHLTDRPFKGNSALEELAKKLEAPKKQQPRRRQSRPNKEKK